MPGRISTLSPLLLALIVLQGCNAGTAGTAQPAAKEASVNIDSVRPRAADLYARYHSTTTLAAVAAADARTEVGGEIIEVLVEEGDRVVKGQPLARLDDEKLRLRAQQAKAELSRRQNELARALVLAARGLVSEARLERLTLDVEEQTAGWELRRLDLSRAVIRAPIAGTIATRNVRIGEQISANSTAFRVIDNARLVAELQVPQSDLSRFVVGQPVHLQADAVTDVGFDATVDRISPTIDPATGTFRLTAYIDNADKLLAPGMFARVAIAYQKHDNAMTLPASAVKAEDGADVVYVVNAGRAERRVVSTGIRQGERVQIISGLGFDEQVIRKASVGLTAGDRLLVTSIVTANSGG